MKRERRTENKCLNWSEWREDRGEEGTWAGAANSKSLSTVDDS